MLFICTTKNLLVQKKKNPITINGGKKNKRQSHNLVENYCFSMADKEVTVFVVDLSPDRAGGAMHQGQPKAGARGELDMVWEVLAGKALRARRTDYVSVVTCHSPTTKNPLAGGGKYQNIEVVADMVLPTYTLMKQLRTALVPNAKSVDDGESDLFLAVIVGLSLLQATASKKFIRNVVVITPGGAEIPSFTEQTVPVMTKTIAQLGVKLVVQIPELMESLGSFHKENLDKLSIHKENLYNWTQLCQNVNGTIIHPSLTLAPPVKRTRPVSLFKGSIQLGSLGFDVEVYPMVKSADLFPKFHQYAGGEKVVRESSNYIIDRNRDKDAGQDDEAEVKEKDYDSDDNLNFNKKPVNKGDWESGFKYSNYDLIATPKQLLELASLQSDPSIDIIGFVKALQLPFAFYTDDSSYVVPRNLGSDRNNLACEAFCRALLGLDSVAIVRYVKQRAKDFQIAALIPMKVANGDLPIYTFSLIRLPYKEDVKIGKFPGLTKISTTSGKIIKSEGELEENPFKFPTPSINDVMEKFILSKDLDQTLGPNTTDKNTFKNFKATMSSSDLSQLPLPLTYNLEDTVDNKLNASSPAIHKFNHYLTKTIQNSLDHDDLNEFLTDPQFISKNLVESNSSSNNMFTLSNILQVNTMVASDWLDKINKLATPHAKELVAKLDIRYVDREEYNKSRKKKKLATEAPAKSKGYFGATEEYGEVPDFDI